MNDMPIADILTIELMNDQYKDMDSMRVHMFTMEVEKVSKGLDIGLSKEIFIDQFVTDIIETYGYKEFESCCEIDPEVIRDLGGKAYELLK